MRSRSHESSFTTNATIALQVEGVRGVVLKALWRPIQLIPEPTLLVYNVYLSLIYGVFYLFFESFPIVFSEVSAPCRRFKTLPTTNRFADSPSGRRVLHFWAFLF
jgi:hypothetical protein